MNSDTNVIAKEEDAFFRRLHTLGNAAQLCPEQVERRTFLFLQCLLFQENSIPGK